MANPSSKSIEIKEATLTSVAGKKYDIFRSITFFDYNEDIMRPFREAMINVIDSGENFISTLPIQGGEKVFIRVYDNKRRKEFSYEFYVWQISSRDFTNKVQTYNLSLISKEALFNEGVRISEKLSGFPDAIVKKILNEYLNTNKDVLTEPCKFKVSFFPNARKAQALIASLQPKAVPKTSILPATPKKDSSTSKSKTSLPSDTQTASGTAGYLFFENKNGFNFRSIDYYYSDGSAGFSGEKPVATYIYKPVEAVEKGNEFVIEEYKFHGELNLVEQLRLGVYSTYMVYYNLSTGAYEEYTYKLKENFDAMSHLGSQTKLGIIQSQLSDRPSRIASMIIDHETWFNSDETGSPEKRDGGGKAPFPDYQKYYIAQGISRRYYMDNQKLYIQIPGNYDLTVGDKIKVLLPNVASQTARKNQKYDEENSGLYLVSKINHRTQFINSTYETHVELIRDTSGMKEYSSNVKGQ